MKETPQTKMLEAVEPNRQKAPNAARNFTLLNNVETRKNAKGSATVNLGQGIIGVHALEIPPLDYQVLILRNPELNSKDHETNKRAWMKFMKSPESFMYKVTSDIGNPK